MANAPSHKIETGDFKQRFAELVRKNIPASRIIKRINDGLDATDTKFFSKEGVVTDSRDVVNWAQRRKTAELASQMGDLWHPRQDIQTTRALDDATLRRLSDIADKLHITSLSPEQTEELQRSHVPLVIASADLESPDSE